MNVETTGLHPCNLRSTTQPQRKAIEQTEAAYAKSEAGVTHVRTYVPDADKRFSDEGSGLEVHFVYRYNDEPDYCSDGLEVGLFAEDGKIVEWQDYG